MHEPSRRGVVSSRTVGFPHPFLPALFIMAAFVLVSADENDQPTSGKIAFLSQRGGNLEIYVMNTDGSDQVRLTNDLVTDLSPAWSPDGTRIAFTSYDDAKATWEIHVMNTDGTRLLKIASGGDPGLAPGIWAPSPVWSPDGWKIAFEKWPGENQEIYVVNPDGTGETKVVVGWSPGWSPDGAKIAFVTDYDGNWEICTVNVDGTGRVNLTKSPSGDYGPAWSLDGTKIAFVRGTQVWVMNADGSAARALAEGTSPLWSPDGTRIGFKSMFDGDWDIYVMNADWTGRRNLSNNDRDDTDFAWSPDGTKITFCTLHAEDFNYDINVMNADGTGLRKLAVGSDPAWCPKAASD